MTTSPIGLKAPRRAVLTDTTLGRWGDLMALTKYWAKVPLIGMCMVFLAMGIVAVTAYLRVGWYSAIGYAIAAVVGVVGFVLTFRDVSNPPPDTQPASPPPPDEAAQ